MELTRKDREDWRLLRIYAWYRLLLSLLLVGLFALQSLLPMLGSSNPPLFLATSLGYLVTTISAVIFLALPRRQVAPFSLILLLVDVLVLTLMTHASGGLNTQLSMLFLVTIAAGNILLSGRLGALIAAVAALGILYEQFYFSLSYDEPVSIVALLQSSILGVSFFAVAMFSQLIVQRMRQGEDLAESRARDIADLQHLNEQIIRRLRTGILAVNAERRILLSNNASQQLLGLAEPIPAFSELAEVSLLLDGSLHAWQANPGMRAIPFKNTAESPEITVNFARLSPKTGNNGPMLLFLEDNSLLAQQAQKLKLGSLGRLTASIAHEVRNPLGAISHATQLLAESPVITGGDRRLLEIIEQHCRRVNSIIENVLSVSRRQPSHPQIFELEEWLLQFREDFLGSARQDAEIEIRPPEPGLLVRFDPEQLRQVLTNLVGNGLRYSIKHSGRAWVHLEAGRLDPIALPYVDVIDCGPGVPTDERHHLFEPFFTTESQGTGLGLYLSREICEANQSRLDYIPSSQGACFRITFAHPDRLM